MSARVLIAVLWLAPHVALGQTNKSMILWHIVHDQCVASAEQHHGSAPCDTVSLDGAYAVLKDIKANTEFLLIPTRQITGIEDPAILAAQAPNYWQAAWLARAYVARQAGHALPRDAIGMAINSAGSRSQNQFHIHVECLKPDVRQTLAQHAREVGTTWSPFPAALAGRTYQARRIDSQDLGGVNPFLLLPDTIRQSASTMGKQTVVVAGTDRGFLVLWDSANPVMLDLAHGEDLLGDTCPGA